MPKPPAIVFDLGKVLVDFDYGINARRLAAHSRCSADEIRHALDQSALLHRYESGQLTTAAFFDEMRAAIGYTGGFAEFCRIFGDIFTAIEPMIDLHARLRVADFSTYIFSNTNELAIRHIRENFPFFAGFDDFIFSFEHGAMKPELKLYEVVEQRTGRRGAELLYIDDRQENIATARPRGWQTILHETPEKTRAALRTLGLEV
ncbi:MAG: HAD family phosphatase [Verrucomicrobia bacterium]|nr:HAD family phosphatase [Verrucomicrobiota bacterium]